MTIDNYPGLQLGSIGQPLAAAIFALAQEAADEVAGPGGDTGSFWAGLIRDGPDLVRRLREHLAVGGLDVDAESIEPGDWDTLDKAAGVIVMREDSGEIAVQAYRADDDLAAAWTAILVDIEPSEPGSPAAQSPEADDNPT
ncbi:MAG: hypothetical protein ACT4P5_10965 [Armatimonadota bacterium]